MNAKPQEARNSTVNLEFVSGEEAIHTLTDMFGADEVARIAREHERVMESNIGRLEVYDPVGRSGLYVRPDGSWYIADDEPFTQITPAKEEP